MLFVSELCYLSDKKIKLSSKNSHFYDPKINKNHNLWLFSSRWLVAVLIGDLCVVMCIDTYSSDLFIQEYKWVKILFEASIRRQCLFMFVPPHMKEFTLLRSFHSELYTSRGKCETKTGLCRLKCQSRQLHVSSCVHFTWTRLQYYKMWHKHGIVQVIKPPDTFHLGLLTQLAIRFW